MRFFTSMATALILLSPIAHAGPSEIIRGAGKAVGHFCESQLARATSVLGDGQNWIEARRYNRAVLIVDSLARKRATKVITPELQYRRNKKFPLKLVNPLGIITLFRDANLIAGPGAKKVAFPAGTHLVFNEDGSVRVSDRGPVSAKELNKMILDSNRLDQRLSSTQKNKIDEINRWYEMKADYAAGDLSLYSLSGEHVTVPHGLYIVTHDGLLVDIVEPDEDYNLRAVFLKRMMSGKLSNLATFMENQGMVIEPFMSQDKGWGE